MIDATEKARRRYIRRRWRMFPDWIAYRWPDFRNIETAADIATACQHNRITAQLCEGIAAGPILALIRAERARLAGLRDAELRRRAAIGRAAA